MKTLLIILLIWIPVQLIAPADRQYFIILQQEAIKPEPKEILWSAICFWESRYDPRALNYEAGGYSIGIAQIRQCKVNDYNRVNGTNYTLPDCFNPEISKKIFMWHYSKYNDMELAAKRWNGSGKMTIAYWKAIKHYL
jgi:hypothetical protein